MLVQEYSRCNTTYVTDKSEAIRGLASEIQSDKPFRFINGLWEAVLEDELLWAVTVPKPDKLNIGVATWSWLKIDGQVSKRLHDYDNGWYPDASAGFSEAVYKTVGHPDLQIEGLPTPQEIDVQGYLFRISWSYDMWSADAPLPQPIVIRSGEGSLKETVESVWEAKWIPDTSPDEKWDTWALQVVVYEEGNQRGQSAGLVIVPVNRQANRWKRVGFYEAHWSYDEAVEDETQDYIIGHEKVDIVLI